MKLTYALAPCNAALIRSQCVGIVIIILSSATSADGTVGDHKYQGVPFEFITEIVSSDKFRSNKFDRISCKLCYGNSVRGSSDKMTLKT